MVSGIDLLGGDSKSGVDLLSSPSKSRSGLDLLLPETKAASTTDASTIVQKPALDIGMVSENAFRQLYGLSRREFKELEATPLISEDFKHGIVESLSGYAELAKNPYEIVRGAAEFITALPGFAMGIVGAGQQMLERVLAGNFNLEELYEAASYGMERDAGWWAEHTSEPLLGKPTQASQIVGATAMAPALALSEIGKSLSEWPRFEDNPNIRGALRFAGDIGGLLALGRVYKGSNAKAVAKIESVVKEASEIKIRQDAVDQIPNKTLKDAQQKIIDLKKHQLELRAKEITKDLDIDTALKEELFRKAEEVERAKIYPIQKSGLKKPKKPVELKEAEGKQPGEVVDIPKGSIDGGLGIRYDGVQEGIGHQWTDMDTKSTFYSNTRNFDEIYENLNNMRKKFDKVEKEPTTDIDLQTVYHKTSSKNAKSIFKEGFKNISILKRLNNTIKDVGADPKNFNKYIEWIKENYSVEEPGNIYFAKYRDIADLYPGMEAQQVVLEAIKSNTTDKTVINNINIRLSDINRELKDSTIIELKVPKDKYGNFSEFSISPDEANRYLGIEKTTDLDLQTGTPEPPELSFESHPFREKPEIASTQYGKSSIVKSVDELVNPIGEKDAWGVINKSLAEINEWAEGKSIDIAKTRNLLSEMAARKEEMRGLVDNFETFVEVIDEAAIFARRAKRPGKSESGTKLYDIGGATVEGIKQLIKGADDFANYLKASKSYKKFKPTVAAKMLKEELKRNFVDRSGNIRVELLDKLGEEGYAIIQKMYLSKGASSRSAAMLKQMQKEVYRGLSRQEKEILDGLILSDRMADIANYKPKFKFPEYISSDGKVPDKTITWHETFKQRYKLTDEKAVELQDRAKAYFEWMKKPLKDMLEAELISPDEYEALISHNYRRIKLVDLVDKRYQTKVGKKKRTVYDSGIEALAKGRTTDIYESSNGSRGNYIVYGVFFLGIKPQAGCCVSLRIHINNKNFFVGKP